MYYNINKKMAKFFDLWPMAEELLTKYSCWHKDTAVIRVLLARQYVHDVVLDLVMIEIERVLVLGNANMHSYTYGEDGRVASLYNKDVLFELTWFNNHLTMVTENLAVHTLRHFENDRLVAMYMPNVTTMLTYDVTDTLSTITLRDFSLAAYLRHYPSSEGELDETLSIGSCNSHSKLFYDVVLTETLLKTIKVSEETLDRLEHVKWRGKTMGVVYGLLLAADILAKHVYVDIYYHYLAYGEEVDPVTHAKLKEEIAMWNIAFDSGVAVVKICNEKLVATLPVEISRYLTTEN